MHSAPRSQLAGFFAIGNAAIGAALVVAVLALDTRWPWVEAGAALLSLLLLLSSVGLLRGTPWRLLALRACAWSGIAAAACALLAIAVWALRMPSAREGLPLVGTATPLLELALLLPYLLFYPALQLIWAHRQEQAPRGAELLLPEEA
jgi:hypothetical protein